METTEIKKDSVREIINGAYDLAINHAIETVKSNISSKELAEFLIEKLKALKS